VVMVVAIITFPGVIAREQAARAPLPSQTQQEMIDDLEKQFGPAGLPKP
ncbi:MAG: hypothetical protein JO216_18995, partial [Hyphomicrobiales bacterium]|nr:hypothetical protein [Hyphomicrobiales bacterium]